MDLDELIARHRRSGILVDANVLLVYVVGQFARNRIGSLKHTDTYVPEDFDTISLILGEFDRLICTPNILTEVSNLYGQLEQPLKGQIAAFLSGTLMQFVDERYVQSSDACNQRIFARLGLTDAGIGMLAANRIAVLTDDRPLYEYLSRMDVDVIKFSHIAPLGWRIDEES